MTRISRPCLAPLTLVFVILAACRGEEVMAPPPVPPPPPPMEVGGSNYVVYSVGEYLTEPTMDVWFSPDVIRPVIASFHLDSAVVKQQLAEMYANGQRRIALVLWYDDFSLSPLLAGSSVRGHIADAGKGRLLPQHEANLGRLLQLIRETGYEELTFRFDAQGEAEPYGWKRWEEARYLLNWSYISSTRAMVHQALAGSSVRVLYDLDMELGGIRHLGLGWRYALRLWSDYHRRFGARNTVAFSIPANERVFRAAMEDFDRAGARPDVYALDIYSAEWETLRDIAFEMRRQGEGAKPVIIQEALYNDAIAAAAVKRAREELHMNIRYVIQWPLSRGAVQAHFSMHFPSGYDAYR